MAIKIKKAKPVYSGMFVTYDKYDNDVTTSSGMLKGRGYFKGDIKDIQKVYRIGTFVKNCKEGDMVQLNLGRYEVHKFEENSIKKDLMEDKVVRYSIPLIEIDGVTYMHIQEQDVVTVIEEWEEVEDTPVQESKIITLENHGLIL